jgi:molecular chaperone DnaJ
MSSTKRDYYEVLEVSRTATQDEIKKSFRKKAKACHPDTNKSPEAESQFKELGEAYDVLSDQQKRQTYDAYGHDGLKSGGYTPGWDFAEGFPDLSDLFSSFFGDYGGGGRRSRGGPIRGDDIRVELSLDFVDAAFGTKKELDVNRLVGCDPCSGSGAAPGSGPTVCTACGGNGQIRQTTQTIIGHFTQIVTCARCAGQGQVIVDPCPTCSGKGRFRGSKTISITVPAGVDHGTRLRVSQEGDAGILNGPAGDLYVVIELKKHPTFHREGYDVLSSQSVPYTTLVLGGEIDVPVLRGTERVKVQPGTPSAHVVQLKQAGIPHIQQSNRRGDHYVTLEVIIPKHVSQEERKLLKRIQELEGSRQLETIQLKQGNVNFMDRMKEVFTGGD